MQEHFATSRTVSEDAAASCPDSLLACDAAILSAHDEDRIVSCRNALERSFEALAAEAELVGWSCDEIAISLFLLAVDHMRMLEPSRRAEAEIHRLNAAESRRLQRG
jgi:hypothetical protein